MNAAVQRIEDPLWFCDGFYNARDPMAAAVKNTRSAMFPARLGELRHLTAFLEAFCSAQAVERSRCLRLNVVLEELFVNSVQHGYRGDCDAPIWIMLDARAEALQITYEDTAPPFNPFAYLPAGDVRHKVGGLGVLLTRELAEGRDYGYLFGRNRVRLSLTR
jgi:serine/threonine-protein kinase RsbW